MHKHNQRGFGHTALLLLVFVIAFIGFVGYRIAKYQPKSPRTLPKLNITEQEPKDLPAAHNAFGFNMLKALDSQETDADKNIFTSPTSISLALSMVYNGADGDTKTEMAKALELQSLDVTNLNQESLGLINKLTKSGDGITLSIANSAWLRKDFTAKPDFLSTIENFYKAKAASLDFNSPDAPKTINDWVSKNTNGKIPAIVDNIEADKMFYLINATYFKGDWTKSFDKAETKDKTFTAASGSKDKKPLMSMHDSFTYLENDDFQSVGVPYGKDKNLSMYVFLPKKQLDTFTAQLDINNWDKWMSQYESVDGTLLLPRFKADYTQNLIPALESLGMKNAFGDSANFAGIAQAIKLSEVLHKTYVDVNEEGTEAAAVTSVGGSSITSVQEPTKEFYMEVNHPFFIAIRDNNSKELLFTGLIKNP